ncbi:MAG: hypothetical protein ABSC31_09845 [Acidimicrobiales bacterium]|jgi:hypothetical protein
MLVFNPPPLRPPHERWHPGGHGPDYIGLLPESVVSRTCLCGEHEIDDWQRHIAGAARA